MTTEDAIEIFEGISELEGISMFYQPGGKAGKLTIHGIKEASQMAIHALRAQQTPAKLDRSRWERCRWCENTGAVIIETHHAFRVRKKRGSTVAIYCPSCGRSLTEEAWAELERRITGRYAAAELHHEG